MRKEYKMITCDLDGTLYNSNSEISPENNAAIREFARRGVPFVACTGRTLVEMKDVVENPDIRYIIYSSGAAILDKQTKEIVDNSLKGEVKEKVLDILATYDVYILVHTEGEDLVNEKLRGSEREYHLNDILCGIVDNLAEGSDNFEADVRKRNVEYLTVFFKSQEELERCRRELLADERVDVTNPWYCNLEIFDKKAGKENAIKILAEKLKIDISQVISIGDSNNDVKAVELAGLGISTSNGSDELKKIADEVACSNDEHVAKYVLEKYFS